MCYRSKTWQSHDQRHLIILELHCFFNPSEGTIFYWGRRGGNNVRVANRARKAVTSCWKCTLPRVVWQFWGIRRRRQHKASLCAWRMEAELMGAGNTNVPQVPVHSALNSPLVLFMGLVGEVGLSNVTRLLYTTSTEFLSCLYATARPLLLRALFLHFPFRFCSAFPQIPDPTLK